MPPAPAVYLRRVTLLALAFLCLFVAYSASQLLQTSLNGGDGYVCLLLVYGCFALSSTTGPYLVARFGPFIVLPISAFPYAVMTASQLKPIPEFLLPACAMCGLGAGSLWIAQGRYIGLLSRGYAASAGVALTDATSLLNARFYTIFATSGGFSAICASLVMMYVKNGIAALFGLLAAVGFTGVFLFACLQRADAVDDRVLVLPWVKFRAHAAATSHKRLAETPEPAAQAASSLDAQSASTHPELAIRTTEAGTETKSSQDGLATPVPEGASAPPPPPSVPALFRFLAGNRRMRLVLPVMFVNGAGQGFIFGSFIATVVAKALGTQYVGFVGASYSFSSAAFARGWGQAVQRPSFGRRGAFAVASVTHILFYTLVAIYVAVFELERVTPQEDPPVLYVVAAFGLMLLFATCDPVWNTMIQATLQTFFPTGPEAASAMAGPRIATATGFMCQQAFTLALERRYVPAQAAVLAVAMAAASSCLWYLDKYVYAIDVRSPVTTAPAAQTAAANVPAPDAAADGKHIKVAEAVSVTENHIAAVDITSQTFAEQVEAEGTDPDIIVRQ